MHAYVDRVIEELSLYRESPRRPVDTVFFGGGTPTLLPTGELVRLLTAVKECFELLPSAEVSIEANPGVTNADQLRALWEAGVNRLSIGLQSIHENEQKLLGRIHDADDFYRVMRDARAAGFDNINVDIMYGIPDQTPESFAATVDAVLATHPTHISAYSLILEEGTPLYDERGSLRLPSEDEELRMVDELVRRLGDGGFRRYEISNYSLNGYRSRHNMKYWTMKPYLGVGLCAHSYIDGRRFSNTRELRSYLSGATPTVEERTEADEAYEWAMLHLRTADGLLLSSYRARFGTDFLDGRRATLVRLADAGLVLLDGDRVALTDRGMYVSNAILTEIL